MRKIVASLILLISFQSYAGGMVGNGGDAVLQEFNLRGIQLAAYFKTETKVAQTYGIDAAKFLETVKKTTLEDQDHLFLNGVEVDAINYPAEFHIQVSRTRWEQSATRPDAYFVQRRIALHEYLWVYGIDDTNYAVSNPIVDELEKDSGQLLDPSVREMLFSKFCDTLNSDDFGGAKSLLSWGLDLNEDCPKGSGTLRTTFQYVLFSYLRIPKSETKEADRLALIKAMLEYGADPNQDGVLTKASTEDVEFARLLLEFGADPNLMDSDGRTEFSYVAGYSDGNSGITAETFWLFFNAGGDVNLSAEKYMNNCPARVIVAKPNNAEVVEALIQTNKVDWCNTIDPAWKTRTLDVVRPEYQPLLSKYHVSCGRFELVSGKGSTCDAAQADGKKQCLDKGYKKATFDPYPDSPCLDEHYSDKPDEFIAMFHCTDY